MPIEEWSDHILLIELLNEPQLTDDLTALEERVAEPIHDVVLNLSRVERVNSTNLAQLLRVRKRLIEGGRRLRLCGVHDGVWSVLLVTGLDKVFEFSEDVGSALASVQMRR